MIKVWISVPSGMWHWQGRATKGTSRVLEMSASWTGGVAWVCIYVKMGQAPHLDLYTLLTSHRIPQWKINAFQSPPQTAGLPFVLFPDEETQCFLERYRMFLSHPLITTHFVSEGKALNFLQWWKWFSVLCSVGATSHTRLLSTWNWLIWNEMYLEGKIGAGL